MKPGLMIATGNPGKLREFQALLEEVPLDLLTAADLDVVPAIHESGQTYAENAAIKARAFAAAAGVFALADDSGLEVDALKGAPGLHSARLAGPGGSDADRRRLLLEKLYGFPPPWTARFRCLAVLADPAGAIWTTEGVCEGIIIPEERGRHGFGYDPIFYLEEEHATMAELTKQRKNSLSHRARALKAMLPILQRELDLDVD